MAGEIGQVFVRVRPNMSGFESETLTGVKKTFRRAAEVAGVAYGAKELFQFGKQAANDAAVVQKSQELVRSEFGKSGQAISAWARDAGIKLGVTGGETLSVAGRFGILFKNLGVGEKQASQMTLNMEKLGASLAAIRGVDPSKIMDRLPVALAGNVRGLKELGVSIDSTIIKQTALQLGYGKTVDVSLKNKLADDALAIAQAKLADAQKKYGDNTTQVVAARDAVARAEAKVGEGVKTTLGALTPAQRAMVVYTIATKNLSDWQAQAAAHANDYANVQKRLHAEWDSAKSILGDALLPIMTKYSNELASWLDRMQRTGKLQREINDDVSGAVKIFKAIADTVRASIAIFKFFGDTVGGSARAVKILIAAFIGFKLASITLAMQKLAEKIAFVGTASETAAGKAGVGGLISKIGALRGSVAAPIVIAVGLKYFVDQNGLKNVLQSLNPFGDMTLGPSIAADAFRGNNPYPVGSPSYFAWARSHGGLPSNVTGSGGPRDQPGQSYSGAGGTGGISGPGDFTHESNAFKNALTALAKSVGAIRLDSGYRSDAHQASIWDESVAAGRQGYTSTGNPIARPASRGGSGSDHSRGIAADGTINYRGRVIPLSSLPASLLARFGLATVPHDVGHVQLAGQDSITSTTGSDLGNTGGLTVGSISNVFKMTKEQIANAKASLTSSYKAIAQIASGLGVEMTAKIKRDMKAAQAAIGGVSDPDTIAKARQGLTNLRAEVTNHMTLLRTRIALFGTFDGLKDQVKKLGTDITPGITASMAKIRAEISKAVTPTEIAKVKAQMTAVKNAITTQINVIKQQAATMTTAFDNAFSRLASGADTAFDRVTQKALAAFQATIKIGDQSFLFGGSVTMTPAEKELADINAQQAKTADEKGVASATKDLADAKAALALLQAPTQAAIASAKANYDKVAADLQVAQAKLDAMTSASQVALSAADVASKQAELDHAKKNLDAMLAAGPTRVPADQLAAQQLLVTQLQAQLDAMSGNIGASQIALQQAAISVLQASLDKAGATLAGITDPTGSSVTDANQAVVDAQAALDAALLQQKETGLQAQAQIERDAATKQLNDAQQAYQDQRDALRTQMDDRVSIIEAGMMNGTIATADGMKQLSAVFADPQYGIDAQASGIVIGGMFYTGLSSGLSKVMELFDQLAAKMKKVGLLPSGDLPASSTTATSAMFAGLSQNQAFMVANASDPQALADALRAANQSLLDELKKQTAIAESANTSGGGASASMAKQVAR